MTECQKCHEDKTDVETNGVFVLCEKCENQVHEFIVFDQRNTNRYSFFIKLLLLSQ